MVFGRKVLVFSGIQEVKSCCVTAEVNEGKKKLSDLPLRSEAQESFSNVIAWADENLHFMS